jgi:hypothetical protein
MSLKGQINNYAKQNGIAAQVVLQNYIQNVTKETLVSVNPHPLRLAG